MSVIRSDRAGGKIADPCEGHNQLVSALGAIINIGD